MEDESSKIVIFRVRDAVKYGISTAIIMSLFCDYYDTCKGFKKDVYYFDDDSKKAWVKLCEMRKYCQSKLPMYTRGYITDLIRDLAKAGLIEVAEKDCNGKKSKFCTIGKKYWKELEE